MKRIVIRSDPCLFIKKIALVPLVAEMTVYKRKLVDFFDTEKVIEII